MNVNGFRLATLAVLTAGVLMIIPGAAAPQQRDARAVEEIKRRYEYREKILLARDFAALERFYPADHIVTNPYNRLVDKAFVMERIRADVISYASFERQFDLFRVYGDTAVVVGSEKVVPPTDTKRPDAGQTIRRRFTEVRVRRDGTWQVVARHASNIAPSN
jgi:hypothetical protein